MKKKTAVTVSTDKYCKTVFASGRLGIVRLINELACIAGVSSREGDWDGQQR